MLATAITHLNPCTSPSQPDMSAYSNLPPRAFLSCYVLYLECPIPFSLLVHTPFLTMFLLSPLIAAIPIGGRNKCMGTLHGNPSH